MALRILMTALRRAGAVLACTVAPLAVPLAAPLPAAAADAPSFARVAEVLRSPRCSNCHTLTGFPRQGDDRHRHQQLVMRGPANQGSPLLPCATCHHDRNSYDGRVPGAPHWQLAPLGMGWEGMDDRELCEAVKDPRRNGNRSVEQLVHHMTHDALVLWAWAPGHERKPPALSRAEFEAALKQWVQAGASCS